MKLDGYVFPSILTDETRDETQTTRWHEAILEKEGLTWERGSSPVLTLKGWIWREAGKNTLLYLMEICEMKLEPMFISTTFLPRKRSFAYFLWVSLSLCRCPFSSSSSCVISPTSQALGSFFMLCQAISLFEVLLFIISSVKNTSSPVCFLARKHVQVVLDDSVSSEVLLFCESMKQLILFSASSFL